MTPYYENAFIKLYKGDCLEIMPQLDITFDYCITDPPYGTTICKWDEIIPFKPMWKELKRLVKNNGAICLFGNQPFSSKLRCSNMTMFRYDWIWMKNRPANFTLAKKHPLKYHEIISVFSTNSHLYYPIMRKGTKVRIKGV